MPSDLGRCQKKVFIFFSSRRRHTRSDRDWSSDVCSSDLKYQAINVLPGTYRITAERRGFNPVAQTVTVKAGETISADLAMTDGPDVASNINGRSEERRVGKECRSRWSPYH